MNNGILKKSIAMLLAVILLAGTLSASFAEEQTRHDTRSFRFYVFDEDPDFMNQTMLFFFDNVDDLPWLDVEELCDLLNDIQHRGYNHSDFNLTYNPEGSTVALTRENDYCMKLDFDANTITFNDYNGFLKDPSNNALLDTLSFTGFNAEGDADLFQRDPVTSFDRYGDMMELNLAEYNIELIQEDDRYYIPLQTANDFLFAPMPYCITARPCSWSGPGTCSTLTRSSCFPWARSIIPPSRPSAARRWRTLATTS